MFDHPLSHPGTLPEALRGKQVAKVGKDGDLPLIVKLSKIPFAILQGGEIFVCQIGLKIHIMKLEINIQEIAREPSCKVKERKVKVSGEHEERQHQDKQNTPINAWQCKTHSMMCSALRTQQCDIGAARSYARTM